MGYFNFINPFDLENQDWEEAEELVWEEADYSYEEYRLRKMFCSPEFEFQVSV